MLYMAIEHFKDGDAKAVYRRFRDEGRLMPEGLATVDTWVETDFGRCFQLVACEDPALLRRVLEDHNDALERGISGVPTLLICGQDVPITGAHPMDLYRRWLDRVLSGEA